MRKIGKMILCVILFIPGWVHADQILFEDFSDGFIGWTEFGSPQSKIVDVHGRNHVFDNMGDSWCNSGAVSDSQIIVSLGDTFSASVYLQVDHYDGCWATISIGLTNKESVTSEACKNENFQQWALASFAMIGNGCWASAPEKKEHSFISTSGGLQGLDSNKYILNQFIADNYVNGWHILKVEVIENYYLKLYIDSTYIGTSIEPIPTEYRENSFIILGSRSSGVGGKAYLDDLTFSHLRQCSQDFMKAACLPDNDFRSGVCWITVNDSESNSVGKVRKCSGFLISDDLVLTAHHCFDSVNNGNQWSREEIAGNSTCTFGLEYESCDSAWPDQSHRNTKGIKEIVVEGSSWNNWFDKDYSLIRLESCATPTQIPYGLSTSIHLGDQVKAYGFPGNSSAKEVACGSVIDLNPEWANSNYLQHDINAEGGASGGPLIDINGKAVGIISKKVLFLEQVAVKIDAIYDEIKGYLLFPPDDIVISKGTFTSGSSWEYIANKSIVIGPDVIIENDAYVSFKALKVTVKSGATFKSGAKVEIKQE